MPDKIDQINKLIKTLPLPKKGLYKLKDNINLDDYIAILQSKRENKTYTIDASELGGSSTGIQSLAAGTNITVDDTDPQNPIISVQDITLSGEVTGSTSLSAIDKTAITNKTTETIVGTDYVLFGDTSDGDNLKKGLVSDIVALSGGGGGGSPITIGTSGNTLYSSGFSNTGQGDTTIGQNIFLGDFAGGLSNSVSYSNLLGYAAGSGISDSVQNMKFLVD